MTDTHKGDDAALIELTRPIIGIENRTAQEAFDIMADRIRSAARAEGRRSPGGGVVSLPTTVEEAVAMEAIGFAWLKENAPEKLTAFGLERPASSPPPSGGVREAEVAQIILGMMVPTESFQTSEVRQRATATAQRLLAMRTREVIPTRDEAALPETPDGWVLVPREPTPEMLDADLGVVTQGSPVAGFVGKRIFESRTDLRPTIYRAMIAAAPPPPPVAELPGDVVRLVIAARAVALHDEATTEELKELDAASEAFADRVPWDDEPSQGEA